MSWFGKELFTRESSNILVFGSNKRGAHSAGAALFAKQHCGAEYGVGFGMTGNSFAIPTKDENIQTLPLEEISSYIRQFLYFAQSNQHLTFYVTAIGCGLAGYQHHQIAPLFRDAPVNCVLPDMWKVNEKSLKKDEKMLDIPK